MANLIRSSALVSVCLLLASSGLACTAASDHDANAESESVQVEPLTGELETQAPSAVSYDPDSTACPPTSALKATQRHVSAIADAFANQKWSPKPYKTAPVSTYMQQNPCTGPDPLAWAEEIDFLMYEAADSLKSNQLWIEGGSVETSVCGLKASKRALKSAPSVRGTYPNQIVVPGVPTARVVEIARALNQCWGAGHRAFLHLDTELLNSRVWIDPEPVRLTANLTGSAGATAAGVFANNTNIATTAVKWPIDGSASTSAAGGTACTTASAASNTTLYKSIVVSSSGWRECK